MMSKLLNTETIKFEIIQQASYEDDGIHSIFLYLVCAKAL